MSPAFLLWCLVLCSSSCVVVYSHMPMEDRSHGNESSSPSLQTQNSTNEPPVIVIELTKASKKNKKSEKKPRKNKFSTRSKRPPPPANCVPLWGSCKSPNAVCCEYCAFCHCRLFKTVCYCRMGYPRC
ncbi:agouti signaling protein 1 [Chanos chanos]|uniref:Agouti-signaling protein n=1 Tax=Chanos chanos TaxID=29144 RepID=A0A6J2VUE5_CHACN|nr:agouti-signaling protein-like [Chanos chanos]